MACQFRSYLWWCASLGLTYDGVPPKFGALGVKTTSDAKINVPKFIEEEGGGLCSPKVQCSQCGVRGGWVGGSVGRPFWTCSWILHFFCCCYYPLLEIGIINIRPIQVTTLDCITGFEMVGHHKWHWVGTADVRVNQFSYDVYCD